MLCLGNDQVATSAHNTYGFIFDQLFVAERIRGVNGHQLAFGLAHDFLCYHQHVTIEQRAIWLVATRSNDDVTELIVWLDFADAGYTPSGETHCHGATAPITVVASVRATVSVFMIVLVTIQRMPSCSMALHKCASTSSITKTPQISA